MRLIDADKLVELIGDDIATLNFIDMPREGYDVCLCTLQMVTQYIKALPTVEPKHGRWIKEHLCSTSGGAYSVERCSNCAYASVVGNTNYCPNCGARMDGGEE